MLFEENFDSGTANGFRNKVGLWQVVRDETGNYVYEVNSMQLPGDVRQFPPFVNHAIPRGIWTRAIGDAERLRPMEQVLAGGAGAQDEWDIVTCPKRSEHSAPS
jgi:hypothetical protein